VKNKNLIYNNFIQKEYLSSKLNKKIGKSYSSTIKKITVNLDTAKNSFHTLSKNYKFNFNMKQLNRFKKFKTVAVVGIGGSILGSEAIYFFLKKNIKKNFIFINDINEDKLQQLKDKKNLNKILFIVISKSGNTIETLSNFMALKIIKKNSKNIIIVSEKSDNPLYLLSQKMNLFHIEHNNYVSGRYSVLSEAGIVPAYLMGINVSKLRKNLLFHFKNINNKFLKDSSIKLTNLFKRNLFKNIIFFNYAPQLDKFLYWNQQLIAESLGKKGRGFFPSVSKAPKDHHSLLQLYLDGPKDKLFYIFCEENKKKDKVINVKNFNNKLNFLKNKSLSRIKVAQKNAFIKTLKKNKIPFREFKIKNFNEETLGEMFSYFMTETAIIGQLSNINPFDQPAVEQVKISTKKNLV